MLVREVMSAPAITVLADLPVKEGLRLLDEHRVTALPVTDDEGRLIGIVSEVDLLRDAVRHDDRAHLIPQETPDPRPKRIEDVMSVLSMTVGLDSDLSDAVELMTSTAVKSVPVVDGGKVVGVISRSDVVHLLARSDDQIHAEVDEMLRSAGLECEVEVVDGRVRLDDLADPHERRIAEVLAGSVSGVIGVVHR